MSAARLLPVLLLASGSAAADPVPVVTVAPAVPTKLTTVEHVGLVEASQTAVLTPRVTAYLAKVQVKEGDAVKRGQVLATLDDAAARLDLDRASAVRRIAEADLELARADLARAEKLAASNAIGREELDKLTALRSKAEAAVKVTEIDRQRAALAVEWHRLVAPFDGRVGRFRIDPGNLVQAGDAVTTLWSADPRQVVVRVDVRMAAHLTRGRAGEKPAPVQVAFSRNDPVAAEGRIAFADPEVDLVTQLTVVRVEVPNAADQLAVGRSVSVRFPLPGVELPTVPLRAMVTGEGQPFVLVLAAGDRLARRTVWFGGESDGRVVILAGLRDGDRVVQNADGLQPGDVVEAKPAKPGD